MEDKISKNQGNEANKLKQIEEELEFKKYLQFKKKFEEKKEHFIERQERREECEKKWKEWKQKWNSQDWEEWHDQWHERWNDKSFLKHKAYQIGYMKGASLNLMGGLGLACLYKGFGKIGIPIGLAGIGYLNYEQMHRFKHACKEDRTQQVKQ